MIESVNQENYISNKIKSLMKKRELSANKLVAIIDLTSSDKLKSICTLSVERINEITNGMTPSVIECIIIGQALGKGLGYFYYNGYQIN